MEQQRKIGLRNRDVVNKEDRISELPEALLLHILSSLPTETVIATSVLSKSWKSLWKMVPNLKFDSRYHHTFSENVCRSLISHKAPVLDSLHLRIGDMSDALDVGILIGIAFARHMRKFVLKFKFLEESYVRFPSAWCSCNDTLEILKLKYFILLDFPSLVCLKSLRKLHLYHVKFKDEESVCNLLCGCPSLEDLVVHRYSTIDVPTYPIVVPSLQRLTIYDYYGEGVGGYVINAPSLRYLNIDGINGLEFCLIEKAPELVEAKISGIFEIANENILESLTSAKRLSLHLPPLKIKYPIGKIFYHLLSLELRTFSYEWWNLLSFMLDCSPKLQILKLIDPYGFARDDCPVGWEWSRPKYVPECLLFHLETFVWTRYEWQREDEKEVATYILQNARQLKKATFITKSIIPENLKKLEKRIEILNQLACEARASKSCRLVFESV
ncbi:unnamed protein product [Arabidopsis halleri]